jgi:Uma2 family endonuclease
MTIEHNFAQRILLQRLVKQLDESEYMVDKDGTRLRIPNGSFYIPDITVLPLASIQRMLRERPQRLEVYEEPVPLVVEVWSPSTGEYDVEVKLAAYQQRGDQEIWRIHPYERTLTAWRLQPDGRYTETRFREGVVEPVALPGVHVAHADLFA